MLAAAKRPLILAGGGIHAARARDELVALSDRLCVPVMAAWRRPTAFPNDHPNYLGMTGYGAPASVKTRLDEADALLVIGSRLNEIATFDYSIPRTGQRWAHVDLAPRSKAVAGLARATIAVSADADAFLRAAVKRSRTYKPPESRRTALAADRALYLDSSALTEEPPWSGPGVSPAHVTNVLQRVLPGNSIVTTDAGNFGLWFARGFRFSRDQHFLGPTSGAMGYGLPAAVAASLVAPDRPVVTLVGDGGLAMTMSELETALRTGARPVVVAFDNRRYGTIAMHQDKAGLPQTATELGQWDFAVVAGAAGSRGFRITADGSFEPALRTALASDRPALLHLALDPSWVTPDRHG
jgi:acetolactate synthase-1/2/3 large subunit